MTSWQPIKTAPKCQLILLYAAEVDNWRMATGYKGHDGVWMWGGIPCDKPYDLKPTHWMPLPEPPKP